MTSIAHRQEFVREAIKKLPEQNNPEKKRAESVNDRFLSYVPLLKRGSGDG